MIVPENEFSHIIFQSRQSLIATTYLRSAQICGNRSSLIVKSSIICHGVTQATVCWQSLFLCGYAGLGQLVAVWQCSLRLLNVQSCYATLEYRLSNICSNKFGIYSHPIFQTSGFSAHSFCLHCSNLRQPFESFHWVDNLTQDCA